MKKFFEEYFYIPKHGKIHEKVMLMRVATTVGIVLACLFAMSVTAFAYFSHDVTSGINILKSAWFNAEITVSPENGSPAYSVTTENNVSTYKFDPGEYVITLKMKDGSTAKTGFCIVKIDGKTYHTQQLGKDVTAEGQKRDSISFELHVKTQSVVVMESHWGTSSFYGFDGSATNSLYIVNSDPMQVLTVGAVTLQSPTPPPAEPTNPVTDFSTESFATSTDSSTSTDSATSTSESSADTNSNVTTDSATEPSDTPDSATDSETSSVSDTKDESETSTEESATVTSTDE